MLMDRFVHGPTVHAGHVEIAHNQVIGAAREPIERRRPAERCLDLVALILQNERHELRHIWIVIDDEDSRHGGDRSRCGDSCRQR